MKWDIVITRDVCVKPPKGGWHDGVQIKAYSD